MSTLSGTCARGKSSTAVSPARPVLPTAVCSSALTQPKLSKNRASDCIRYIFCLSLACAGLGQHGPDQAVEALAVGGHRSLGLRLLARQRVADVGEAALDALVHGHRPADERAHAGRDLGIQRTRVAAGNLDTGELAGTT